MGFAEQRVIIKIKRQNNNITIKESNKKERIQNIEVLNINIRNRGHVLKIKKYRTGGHRFPSTI